MIKWPFKFRLSRKPNDVCHNYAGSAATVVRRVNGKREEIDWFQKYKRYNGYVETALICPLLAGRIGRFNHSRTHTHASGSIIIYIIIIISYRSRLKPHK